MKGAVHEAEILVGERLPSHQTPKGKPNQKRKSVGLQILKIFRCIRSSDYSLNFLSNTDYSPRTFWVIGLALLASILMESEPLTSIC